MAARENKSRAQRAGWEMKEGDRLYELLTTGMLPFDRSGMTCIRCGLPVALLFKHEPYDPFAQEPGFVGPGTVWGEDVDVICMCCSYNKCEHKERKSA
jgi:hypothetical protein